MEYLRIKRSKNQLRADGSRYATPVLVTKSAKYGERLSEKTISIKKPILLTGEPNSGKTRWISRLHEHAAEIWGTKIKAKPLRLEARRTITEWHKAPAVRTWWRQQQKTRPQPERQTWTALTQKERSQALADYCADTGAVVFIDDAHKLGGPALTLAKNCVQVARIWVVAAYQEQHIPPRLLAAMVDHELQRFELRIFPKTKGVSQAEKPETAAAMAD